MAYCICGFSDGTNPTDCERCKLLDRIQKDEDLLRQAHHQLVRLNSLVNEANNEDEPTSNVVALMIEERLKEER